MASARSTSCVSLQASETDLNWPVTSFVAGGACVHYVPNAMRRRGSNRWLYFARMSRSTLGAAALAWIALAWAAASAAPDEAILRTNIPADPAQLEPITQSELISGDIIANMYEGFTTLDTAGNLVPALALSWQLHSDELGFRFKLRRGVEFHSGREFTAADVKFTYEQILLPENRGGANTRYLANVIGAEALRSGTSTTLTGIRVVNRYTVDVRFMTPDALFPLYPITFIDSGVLAEGGLSALQTRSAGTGPFRLRHWQRGQQVWLERHSGYWNGPSALEGVSFVIVPNGHTAVSMFEANELDLLYADQATARRILRNPDFDGQRLRQLAAQIQYLGMNQRLYRPFGDIRVREAICRAIDREAIAAGLESGAAQPLHGQTAPHVAGYNSSVAPITYDPDRARELLQAAASPGAAGLPELEVTGTAPNKYPLVYIAISCSRNLACRFG